MAHIKKGIWKQESPLLVIFEASSWQAQLPRKTGRKVLKKTMVLMYYKNISLVNQSESNQHNDYIDGTYNT